VSEYHGFSYQDLWIVEKHEGSAEFVSEQYLIFIIITFRRVFDYMGFYMDRGKCYLIK